MIRVEVTPVPRVFYRGPGEFDMSSRGVYSSGRTLFYPLPTTFAGLLGYLYGESDKDMVRLNNAYTWIDEFKTFLGDIIIRGPFLKTSDSTYLIYDLKNKGLIKIGDLTGVVEIELDILMYNATRIPRVLDCEKCSQAYTRIQVDKVIGERIGIYLQTRTSGIKTVSDIEGEKSIYSINFIYTDKLAEIAGASKYETCKYIYYLLGNYNKEKLLDIGGTYRFGGESSLARLSFTLSNFYLDLERYIELINQDGLYLYVVSPLLINTGINDIHAYLINHISERMDGLTITDIKISGETRLLAPGFASKTGRRRGVRRPIYEAFMPGTVIYLKIGNVEEESLMNLITRGLGEASNLGFGTVLPFKPIYRRCICDGM